MDWTNIGDSLVPILVTAVFTVIITFFAQWILTNWKIKREFRIHLLDDTFNPLYKFVSDVLEALETQAFNTSAFTVPRDLRKTIISDIRFSMLKENEQNLIKQVETLLDNHFAAIWTAQRKLDKLLEDALQPLKLKSSDVFKDGVWSAFMDTSTDAAEYYIQDQDYDPEMEKQLLEITQMVIETFKATPEYQNYMNARSKAIPTIDNFRKSLTKWAKRMFSLTSR